MLRAKEKKARIARPKNYYASKQMWTMLQVKSFKITPSKSGYPLDMKLHKQMDIIDFEQKLAHGKCAVCECGYLTPNLPNEVTTFQIQEMFEQANRIGIEWDIRGCDVGVSILPPSWREFTV